ncbi:MAG TPA: phosphohydrolase [Desulfobulbaceae bacterium]|nr:phosphohydrolase [Desulfobulbaceae bacterium]
MKCPGQDMKYWKENAIFEVTCPKCQALVEFYKDDTSRKCGSCGHRFVNPKMDFGCASYCQYAEQCIGALPEEFTGGKEALLKEKVAVEMKRYFQTDFKSIRQASSTAQFAENIGKTEGGAKLAIVLCAAYLSGTGLAAARTILQKVGANEQMIEEICLLLAEQQEEQECRSLPAKILHDALILRTVQEELKEQPAGAEQVQQHSAKLITDSARDIAASLILP